MKNARRGNRAGAKWDKSNNYRHVDCLNFGPQVQSFQTIGALPRQVINDLIERHARQLAEA